MDAPSPPKSGRVAGYKVCYKTKVPEILKIVNLTVITRVSQITLSPFVSCGTLPDFS